MNGFGSTPPARGLGEDGWRGKRLFVLLAIFILGFYLLPSNWEMGSTPHDLLFFLGTLPAFIVLGGPGMWRVLQRGGSGNRLLALGLVFIVYLGVSALWTRGGDRELTPLTVALYTVGTAVFLVGLSQVLKSRRWRRLRVMVVVAATSIAGASVIAFFLGHQSYPGRLNSVIHFEHPNLFAHSMGFAALICVLRVLEIRRSGEGKPRRGWPQVCSLSALSSSRAVVRPWGLLPSRSSWRSL